MEKAAVVSQKLIVCRAEGLGNHMWFILRHSTTSSLNPRDNFPALDHLGRIRPVVLAHNTAARCLRQTRKVADYDLGELGSAYLFGRPGENVLVAFAGDLAIGQVMTVSFDQPVNAVLYDMLGGARELRIDKFFTLPLEYNPVYLVLRDNAVPTSVAVRNILQMPWRVIVERGQKASEFEIGIENIFDEPLRGSVCVQPSGGWTPSVPTTVFEVAPGQVGRCTVKLASLPGEVADNAILPVQVMLDSREYEISASMNVMSAVPLAKRAGWAVDGDMGKWDSKTRLAEMDTADYVQELMIGEADPDLHWQGPEDMSASLHAAWDEASLRLALTVEDNVHFQERHDDFIYQGDSIQIALGVLPERYVMQLGLALADGEPILYFWEGGMKAAPPYVVRREGTRTIYEIAIPLKELGIEPTSGNVVLLSVLINDNDGRGRKAIMEWGRGIHGVRSTALFRPLMLVD